MHQIEWSDAVLLAYGANCAQRSILWADIVDVRPQRLPFGGPRFLIERKYLYVVVDGEPFDQGQYGGNDPIFQRPVDAPGNYKCYAHGMTPSSRAPSPAAHPTGFATPRPIQGGGRHGVVQMPR